ncbi:MAG: hypothetical protein JSW65_00010 [Candidatus Bipolaricaulota bacterium]|nr:MAG: hypothetical protein JSW65_00010 [Candidatus Bipolaricaulota bacterium]
MKNVKTWSYGLSVLVALLAVGLPAASATVDLDAAVGATAAAGLFDTYVEGLLRTMTVLALTDEARSADWETIFPLLQAFQDTSLPMATWFLEPDGGYYTVSGGRSSANLSDRAYFPVVMGGEIASGYLVVSRSTGRKSMVAVVPVLVEETVVGGLGVSVFLDTLSEAIGDDLDLPEGLAFLALTPEDEIALHSDTDLLLLGSGEADVSFDDGASAVSDLLGWTFWVAQRD